MKALTSIVAPGTTVCEPPSTSDSIFRCSSDSQTAAQLRVNRNLAHEPMLRCDFDEDAERDCRPNMGSPSSKGNSLREMWGNNSIQRRTARPGANILGF